MKTLMETQPTTTFASLILGLAAAVSAIAADLKVPAAYPTIQAAVDAAQSNDNIHISPGVYTGQVQIISKKLTLIGQPGAILRATTNMSSIPGNNRLLFPMMNIEFSEVMVRGLTFEGERLAGRFVAPGELKGVLLQQSSANVENCVFYGFRESTPGAEYANALNATGFADGTVNVRVAGCTFADNYLGIFFVGVPNRQSMNVTVENNTIVGPGPLGNDSVHQGIYIREGVGGRIAGNTISGFSYVGTASVFPISQGILASNGANFPPDFGILQPLLIEGNTFRDNQEHIALVKADNSVIRNNRFQGTAPGILPLGLAVTGTNVAIANNQFEDMPEGIRLLGNDPIFGTVLGKAEAALVASNRFCNVTTPINVQTLASAMETGTLRCPFMPPALEIVPAVILSWPGADDGWTIESATTVDGPWTASDATIFTQSGRLNSALPTEVERRFFRLGNP